MLLCATSSSNAQSDPSPAGDDNSAINWTANLSWQEIKQKAKNQNKYIFVDCYATWCKPCKQMDTEVYTVDSVGEYLNAEFISVKVQMDQTNKDDASIKSWYKTAKDIAKRYSISAYPSYVFFAPNGEVVSKETGYKKPGAVLQVARDAKDPSKQYFVLLKNYKKGKLDDSAKRSLIKTARQLNDTVNYRSLRESYFLYLHALPKEKFYTKDNIEFIASTISRKSHVVFDMFYPDGSAVDKVMGKNGYAKNVVDDVITKEKMANVLNTAMDSKVEPDWNNLYKSIAEDYNMDYAARNTLVGKIQWYGFMQPDVLKFATSLNDKIEKYGSDTTSRTEDFKLNNAAMLIWKHVGTSKEPTKEDIDVLNRVINWMEGVVRRKGIDTTSYYHTSYWHTYIDTYANLLHKVGRTVEAIRWEEFAILKCKELDGGSRIKEYEKFLDKMKKGEPTWPVTDEKIDEKK